MTSGEVSSCIEMSVINQDVSFRRLGAAQARINTARGIEVELFEVEAQGPEKKERRLPRRSIRLECL